MFKFKVIYPNPNSCFPPTQLPPSQCAAPAPWGAALGSCDLQKYCSGRPCGLRWQLLSSVKGQSSYRVSLGSPAPACVRLHGASRRCMCGCRTSGLSQLPRPHAPPLLPGVGRDSKSPAQAQTSGAPSCLSLKQVTGDSSCSLPNLS